MVLAAAHAPSLRKPSINRGSMVYNLTTAMRRCALAVGDGSLLWWFHVWWWMILSDGSWCWILLPADTGYGDNGSWWMTGVDEQPSPRLWAWAICGSTSQPEPGRFSHPNSLAPLIQQLGSWPARFAAIPSYAKKPPVELEPNRWRIWRTKGSLWTAICLALETRLLHHACAKLICTFPVPKGSNNSVGMVVFTVDNGSSSRA